MVRAFCLALLSAMLLFGSTLWSAEPDDSDIPDATPAATDTDAPQQPAEKTDEKPSPEPEDQPITEPEVKPAIEEPSTDSQAADEPGRKYELKYKFEPGQELRTEVIHKAVVQTTIQGTSQSAETTSKSIKLWRVSEVTGAGNVTFVHSVASIDMRQKMQGRREVHYNSETDKEVPHGYEEAAAAVGVPLTVVTMDAHGKILKRQEKRPQPGGTSTQMTMPLAEGPVAIGDTWTSPVDIEVTLTDGKKKKIQTRQRFTLLKVVAELATIEVDSQILTPISDPAIEAQLIQRLSAGTVKFDIARGQVVQQQLDLDRNVIGFSGPASSMHYVTRFSERLLPPAGNAPSTARKPSSKASDKKAK